MSPSHHETASPPSAELIAELRGLVRRNTRRWRRLLLLEMAAVLIAAPLMYLWVVFFMDILMHLSRGGRIAASSVFIAILLVLIRWIWRQWKVVRLTEDQVALAIEG